MPGSRLVSRSLVVAGILLFVAALRLDQAVQTAYDASWIAPDEKGSPFSCTQCRRLPSDWWLLWYFMLTVGSIGSLLGAVWLWRWRCLDATGSCRSRAIGSSVVAIGWERRPAWAGWQSGSPAGPPS